MVQLIENVIRLVFSYSRPENPELEQQHLKFDKNIPSLFIFPLAKKYVKEKESKFELYGHSSSDHY